MYKIERLAIPMVQKKLKGAKDHCFMFDGMGDMFSHANELKKSSKLRDRNDGDWSGNLNTHDAVDMLLTGDLSKVGGADKTLAKLEALLHVTSKRFRVVDDVAGALPNIPAMLAGQPMSMRYKKRVADDRAPLTVVVDTTSSCNISAKAMKTRGAVILAFVRAMTAQRPIKLVVACGLGDYGLKDSVRVFVPIETAPLDLARAAYALVHVGFARALCYPVIGALYGRELPSWPYNDNELARQSEAEFYSTLFDGEVFNIPGPYGEDKNITNPEEWLLENLEKYGLTPNKQAA